MSEVVCNWKSAVDSGANPSILPKMSVRLQDVILALLQGLVLRKFANVIVASIETTPSESIVCTTHGVEEVVRLKLLPESKNGECSTVNVCTGALESLVAYCILTVSTVFEPGK